LQADPAAFQRLGRELAEKIHKSGGASVITGIGSLGNSLMGHVARFYDEIRQSQCSEGGKPVPPVFRFEIKTDGNQPSFVCEGAEQIVRGKSIFLVTPVIVESDGELILACAKMFSALTINATVVGVGAIIIYGEPQKPQETFRDLALLRNTGLK
jgi:hypothetical protein